MASAPEFDIDHVAQLARIALTAEEKKNFSAQLGDVLAHIAQLQEVDVSGIEPTAHAFPMDNVWAEDAAKPGLSAEAALRNAPAQRDGMFLVPKVVE
jgi:aspartyl-tRNA(Asn)/glutamyl-tRNA(Gln) amidotransferase subunit C